MIKKKRESLLLVSHVLVRNIIIIILVVAYATAVLKISSSISGSNQIKNNENRISICYIRIQN